MGNVLAISSKYSVNTCPAGGMYVFVRYAVHILANSGAIGNPMGIPLSPR